ncbi:hypothetical protein CDEF62S_03993 [Castellaniella defragrans]
MKAGGDINLVTTGSGSIGAQEGEQIIALPAGLGSLTDDSSRGNAFNGLPEAEQVTISHADASDLAGVYQTLYQYMGDGGATVGLDTTTGSSTAVDFSDTALWQPLPVTFSTDAALATGEVLAANSDVQFLFASSFGLYTNRQAVFVYNSQLAGDPTALSAAISNAVAQGLPIIDIGNGVMNPVWQSVTVPYQAGAGAESQVLQHGALVADSSDPQYLTIRQKRTIAVDAGGLVSASSATTVGLESSRGSIRLGQITGTQGVNIEASADGLSIIGRENGTASIVSSGLVSLVARSGDIIGGTMANGVYQVDYGQDLQLGLGAGHSLYIEAGGIARINQVSGSDLNLVLAQTQDTTQGHVSYYGTSTANLLVGQVQSAGTVQLVAGGSILNATDASQRRNANVSMSDLTPDALAGLGYQRQIILQAGAAIGQPGADLSQVGTPLLIDMPAGDTTASLVASATQGINLYSLGDLRLANVNGGDNDIRLFALGSLTNGSSGQQAAVYGRNAWLQAQNGSIGNPDTPLLTDLTGSLYAVAQTTLDIDQVGAGDLLLSHVESVGRDAITLSAAGNIVDDTSAHPLLSSMSQVPVVIGGSLNFVAGGNVGTLVAQDVAGIPVNRALVVAAVGDAATISATAVGDVALVQLAQATDATGAPVVLSLNVGTLQAANAWLVARYANTTDAPTLDATDRAKTGNIDFSSSSVVAIGGVLSLLAGNNITVASGAALGAATRLVLRADHDDRGPDSGAKGYGKQTRIQVNGALSGATIDVEGSDAGDNIIDVASTASVNHGSTGTLGTLTITGGSGADTVSIESTDADASVQIDTLQGVDQVSVTGASITGDLSITSGDGAADAVTVKTSSIGGDTSILLGAGAADTVSFTTVAMSGNLSVTAGDGGDTVAVTSSSVGKDTSVTTGSGDDSITFTTVTMTGNLSIAAGDGTNDVTLTSSSVGKDATITSGAGADTVLFTDSAVGGNTLISTGAGNDAVTLDDSSVGAGLLINVGDDDNTVTLKNGTTVGEAATLPAAGPVGSDPTSTVTAAQLARGIEIDAGTGTDTIDVDTVTVAGGLLVRGGTLANTVTLNKVNLGAGTQGLSDASTEIDTQGGDDTVTFTTVTMTGNLSVAAGDGKNAVTLTSSSVGKDAAVTAGIGDDTVLFDKVTVAGDLLINAGAGNNTITVEGTSGADPYDSSVGGNAEIDTLGGTDTIAISNTGITGKLTVSTGDGDGDSVTVTHASVGGDTQVTEGDGAGDAVSFTTVTVGGDTVITEGAGVADEVTFMTVAMTGNLSVATGDGGDTVTVTSSSVGKDATITSGAGVDTVLFTDSAVGGNTLISTGAGNDAVTLDDSSVGAGLLINVGDDDNTVTLKNGTTVGEAATLPAAGPVGSDPTSTVTAAQLARGIEIDAGTGTDIIDVDTVMAAGGLLVRGGTLGQYGDAEQGEPWGGCSRAGRCFDRGRHARGR